MKIEARQMSTERIANLKAIGYTYIYVYVCTFICICVCLGFSYNLYIDMDIWNI